MPEVPGGGADRGGALDRVLELTVLLGADMERDLAARGLTTARTHLLWEVHRRGPCTQQTLAGALGVSPRNVTGLVDGLVATGFVTREPHPTDRRATLVTLTGRGAQVAGDLVQGRGQLADLLFTGIPDEVYAGLVEGLDIVLARLRDALGAGGEQQR
jgi:DNA-binding MarR family transcriptional regulator